MRVQKIYYVEQLLDSSILRRHGRSYRAALNNYLASLEWLAVGEPFRNGHVATNDKRTGYQDVNWSQKYTSADGQWSGEYDSGTIGHRSGLRCRYIGSDTEAFKRQFAEAFTK